MVTHIAQLEYKEEDNMKYVCLECGEVFDEDEIVYVDEDRGEFWGAPCTERMSYSPCCEADFDEAAVKQVSLDILVGKDSIDGFELARDISELLKKHGYKVQGEDCTGIWDYEDYERGNI